MSEYLKMASELAKLASMLAPGIEDEIGRKRNSGPNVQDNIDSNKNLSWYSEQFAPQQHLLEGESPLDLQVPTLADAQADAVNVYGDQSHNSDFYPQTVDQKVSEMMQGGNHLVARKATKEALWKKAQKKSANSKEDVLLRVANQLIKLASELAPGIEDTIGQKRNQGALVQDNIDSNKSYNWYQGQFKSQSEPLTSYSGSGGDNWDPSMDTGGFTPDLGMEEPKFARKATIAKAGELKAVKNVARKSTVRAMANKKAKKSK